MRDQLEEALRHATDGIGVAARNYPSWASSSQIAIDSSMHARRSS